MTICDLLVTVRVSPSPYNAMSQQPQAPDIPIDPVLLAMSAPPAPLAPVPTPAPPAPAMAPKKESAFWTPRNEKYLVTFLLDVHTRAGDGGNFTKAVWTAAAAAVNADSHTKGAPKSADSCKSKFGKVRA